MAIATPLHCHAACRSRKDKQEKGRRGETLCCSPFSPSPVLFCSRLPRGSDCPGWRSRRPSTVTLHADHEKTNKRRGEGEKLFVVLPSPLLLFCSVRGCRVAVTARDGDRDAPPLSRCTQITKRQTREGEKGRNSLLFSLLPFS